MVNLHIKDIKLLYKYIRRELIIIDKIIVKEESKLQEDLEYKRLTLMYTAALKQLETKMEIINNEFKTLHRYNPIEHISTRIKSKESINRKLNKKGLDPTYENLVKNINDVAGMRIICSFIPDIYKLVEMLENMPDITIIKKKDYVSEPKESGYTSYHLIVSVPVSLSVGSIDVKVEIQIRTMAMDFWASLEHKINYKYDKQVPKGIKKELKECAKMTQKLDRRMSHLGKDLMREEEKLLKEITTEYSTVYSGLMISENIAT